MQTQNLQIIPKGIKPIIKASQFDVGREFQLKLYDGAVAYTPPTGTTLRLDGVKPDGTVFSYTENLSLSGSTITVTTTTQMTILEGTVQCEIRMTKDNDDIGTINFDLMVEKSPINETTDLSQTEVPALVTLARTQMENAEAWAVGTKDGEPVSQDDPQYNKSAKYWAQQVGGQTQDAEAWAVGTKDGVPVTSGEPQYHNNAKYYSDGVHTDAQAAAASALVSEGYATGKQNGTDVTSTSPYYHNNAAYFAGEAADAATTAANAAVRAEAAVVLEPYIGANGNWYVYDFSTNAYVDTGVDATGATGNGIASIAKTSTSGLIDTYTILYTNGSTSTFTVTNGQNGTGAGDMLAANYDPTQAVFDAGGIVAYVASQMSGLSTSLSGLTDVALTSLAAGQSLVYDATEQKWVNGSISASNVNYTNTTSGLTATKVQNAIDEVVAENQTLTNNVKARAELSAYNLLNIFNSEINTSGTYTEVINDDGTVTIGGTPTSACTIPYRATTKYNGNIYNLKPNTDYVLDSGLSAISPLNLQVFIKENSSSSWSKIAETTVNTKLAFTTPASFYDLWVRILVPANAVVPANTIVKPMIILASDITIGFVPYAKTNQELTKDTNAIEPMLNVLGAKNLLQNTASSATVNGVTFTVNSDGSVTANGTATAIAVFYIAQGTWDSPKDIILSGCPSGGSVDTYALELAIYGQYDTGNGLEKSGVTVYNTRIRIASGYTVSNLTFYPMIRPASIEDDTYVPYAMTNKELTERILSTIPTKFIKISTAEISDSYNPITIADELVATNSTEIVYVQVGSSENITNPTQYCPLQYTLYEIRHTGDTVTLNAVAYNPDLSNSIYTIGRSRKGTWGTWFRTTMTAVT